jgi:hypothetical protein
MNVKLHGYTHNLEGMEIKSKSFPIELPFKNKTHTDMLTEATQFKSQKAQPINIKNLEVSSPFKLASIEPKLPITVNGDEKVVFKMMIEAPEHNYTGPLNITFVSDGIETVHIEITKTVLVAKGQRVPIETSGTMFNIPKGQIFVDKVQLYKAFSFGDVISKVEVSEPFAFAGSEPKLPVKIDDTNSYILNLYIQAPATTYAGELEVRIS